LSVRGAVAVERPYMDTLAVVIDEVQRYLALDDLHPP
jgi:hypothetical protein